MTTQECCAPPFFPPLVTRDAEESSKVRAPTAMKTFEQSAKSQKTVKSMIETRGEKPKEKTKNKKNKGSKKEGGSALQLRLAG